MQVPAQPRSTGPSPRSPADDVTIDQVIEAVADAITQLVVFSLEAEENNSILPSIIPGAQAVAQTVDALVAIVDSMAVGFSDEPQIQQKMTQAGGVIRNATSQLVSAAQAISRNQFDQAAKKKLLELAKDLLQNTVRELHLTDKYEVFKIIKAANLCKGDVAKGRSSAISADDVMALARSLSANVVHLVQLVNKRVAHNIVDPTMKRRMVTANDTLKNNTKGLVVAMGEALKSPREPERKQEQYRVARLLDQAIDEIIEVAKLSCKTLFDSLDFDLGTPSGSAQVFTDPSAGLRAAHAQLVEGFRELDDSAARRAAQEAAKALQKISEALNMARQMAENCDDPELRKRLLEAIAELERIQQQLVPLVKAALRGDKDALAKLQGLLDEARKYADTIAEIAAWQELAACARDVDAALDRLADAIKRGDRAAALEAKADVERGLKRELELLAELPQNIKDAYWKDRLAQIRARLAELLKAFPAIADAAIANPNNKKAVDDLANVSTKIKEAHVDLTNSFPGRWDKEREREAELERQRQRERERAAQERQAREKTGDAIVDAGNRVLDTLDSKEIDESTPEGRVYAASKRVAEDMKLLSAAANRGDKAEVIAIARRIAQHVRDIQTNCNEISTKCKDPRLREQVLGAAGAVSSITVQLKVITAVKAASDPNDPTIKAQLVKCAESLASNLVNTVNAVEIATIRY